MLMRETAGTRWHRISEPQAEAHARAAAHIRQHQEDLLLNLLRDNAGTSYGQTHGFGAIRSLSDFQERVPVVDYASIEPFVQRMIEGEPNVLTAEPVLAFERSSGSARAAKYIPYTQTLLDEFRRVIGAWMHDLLSARPALRHGSHYWSISPLARSPEVTPGGIPVGFATDTGYLDPGAQDCLSQMLAVPGSVATVGSLEECRQLTLEHLVRRRDLRFISVWSPSFLLLLLDQLPSGLHPAELWPDLQLVSCWTSATSARFLPELAARLPGVEVQGKGLLATEGVVSFPVIGSPAPVPAVSGHVLEFLDDAGRPHLADDLEVGNCYRTVITTGGGLTRYDLGDRVRVVAPGAIEFVGKAGTVSDLCGEKLSIERVDQVLPDLCAKHRQTGFAMLAPELADPPYYALILEHPPAAGLVEDLEHALREAHDYDYCRRLGQLGPVRPTVVADADERFLQGCIALGQRAGDVKSTHLRKETGWRSRMGGSP